MKANDLDHERCSELLGRFVRGDLPPDDEAAVRSHLRGCESCAEEHRGLERLLAEEIEPLSELERTRLRASISSAVRPSPRRRGEGGTSEAPSAPGFPRRRSWSARLAPALGAAALLVLVAAGVYGALQSAGEDDLGGAAVEADSPAPESGREKNAPGRASDEALTEEAAGTAFQAGGGDVPAAPTFEPDLGTFTLDDLRRLGRTGGLFGAFASVYDNSDASDLEGRYLVRLSERAPDDSATEQTRRCGDVVLRSLGNPVLAAYGAHGALRRDDTTRDALVLGFAYSSGDQGPLDRFMFWVWPREDCDAPLEYVSARIKR
ncbi:MAG: anti-sigma factor family protein [Actinomycetota bacterium]